MSLVDDVRGEIKTAKKLRLPGWGVLCVIIGSFLCAELFDIVWETRSSRADPEHYCGTWFYASLEAKAVAAGVVLGHHVADRVASCPFDSVCSLGYQMGSGVSDSRHRFGGLLLDTVDYLSRRKVKG